MALLGDNMDEEMMSIIYNGTQFIFNDDKQDVDDESQYLALENEQENTSKVNIFKYVAIISCACISYFYFCIYSPLNRGPQSRRAEMFEAKKTT
jgi:hypothetical protein